MNTTKFSDILLDKLPKKINNIVENVLDILFNVNQFIRELNSLDFCNPLGYILTKTLPADGLIDKKLKEYGDKVTKFINESTSKLELNNSSDISEDIELLRLSLEDLILPEELKDIIPGGDGLTKLLQDLNDSLVITNTFLSINDKKKLIKSFINRLIPLSNPTNLTEALLANKAYSINKTISEFIKPERFRSGLLRIIKTTNNIDKSINQIKNIIILINKIIKSINVLIKIFNISSKIIQKLPIPAQYVTSGTIITASTKVGKFETDISDLSKLLNSISIFLSQSVVKQIKRIRDEIFILLIGLNQLYENINNCSYFSNDILLDEIQKSIKSLNDNINTLEELFPSIKQPINTSFSLYKGYNINIIKEETTDNRTNLFRKLVIVTNSQNILEYESTPTYASDDQILIKEGQFFIDKKYEVGTGDNGVDNITDEETSLLLSQIGMKSTTLKDASNKENEVNKMLYDKIQNNPEDKKLYDLVTGSEVYINQDKVEQIKRIVNNITKYYNNKQYILLQNRLKILSQSLIQKGYKPQEIEEAYKSTYSDKFNITIINNNITISKK